MRSLVSMKWALPFGLNVLLLLASHQSVAAADLSPMPVKVPPIATPNWTGFYLGSHFGYAGGASNWTANDGVAPIAGSIDLFNTYDAFKGTGSYFFGLQAGYNNMLPSGVVLGAERDFSAVNTRSPPQTPSRPSP